MSEAMNFPIASGAIPVPSGEGLSDFERHILVDGGTERPHTGEYNRQWGAGIYHCRGCGQALFRSDTKFDAGCGWPSFFEPITPDAVLYLDDDSLGMYRVEVRCGQCGGHLGHVFPDAPHTPTGHRYCMNSASLSFTPDADSGD